MPRIKKKTVPGCYDPIPHDDYEYSRLTMEEIFRIVVEELDKNFDRWTSDYDHERLEDKKEKN